LNLYKNVPLGTSCSIYKVANGISWLISLNATSIFSAEQLRIWHFILRTTSTEKRNLYQQPTTNTSTSALLCWLLDHSNRRHSIYYKQISHSCNIPRWHRLCFRIYVSVSKMGCELLDILHCTCTSTWYNPSQYYTIF
jgi:hypothetical protein